MASRPEVFRPVDAWGTLRIDTPGGRPLELVAEGQVIGLELPVWQDIRAALPRSFRARRRTVRLFANVFSTHGLTLSLESNGESVFRLGYNTSPNWIARLLGLAPAHVPLSAIRMVFRRRAPAPSMRR